MSGLGMILAGLSGGGNATATVGRDYQRVADEQAAQQRQFDQQDVMERLRSDLNVEQASRIAENSQGLANRQYAATGKIYADAASAYAAANPDATPADAQRAGQEALIGAGRFPEAAAANAPQSAADVHAAAVLQQKLGKVIQTGYGGTTSAVSFDEDGNPVVSELVDNSDKRLKGIIASHPGGAKPLTQSQIEMAQIRAHQLVADGMGSVSQPFPLPTDDPSKPVDPALLKLANSKADKVIGDAAAKGAVVNTATLLQSMAPTLKSYDESVKTRVADAALKLFPPSSGFMGMGTGDQGKPGSSVDPAVRAQFMKFGVPERALVSPMAFQRYARDEAMNLNDFERFENASANSPATPAARGSAAVTTAPNPVAAPSASSAQRAKPIISMPSAPVGGTDLTLGTGLTKDTDPVLATINKAIAALNPNDPANVQKIIDLGLAKNRRLTQLNNH